MLTRRTWVAGAAASVSAQTQRKPNFLFLIADDHAGYVLGADGNRRFLDPESRQTRIRRNTLRRASLQLAGLHSFPPKLLYRSDASMAGVTRLPTPLSDNKPTIAKQLRAAGYSTGVIGKMHFNRRAEPGLHGFDYMMTEGELNQAWARDVKPRPIPPEIRTKPRWQPFKDPARIWLNGDKLPYPRYEEEMKAHYQVKLAEHFLDEHKDKPFALWVSFLEPHSPFDFPIEDRTRPDAAQFTPPRVGPEDAWQIPKIFRDLNDDDKRGIIAAYYTSAHYLDRNLGRVLAKLHTLGLDENTLVVYTADHGYDLGHHGRFEKHCGYDPALRVPLMMRWPGHIRQGVVRDFTEHIDLAPTLLDLLNADPLPVQHGQSLRPYLEAKRFDSPRDHIFSQYSENEEAFLRTKQWKFIFCSGKRARGDGYDIDNPTPGRYIRLYDIQKDPGEFTDVAKQNPKIVQQMESLILERFRKTHPDASKEPQRLSREEAIEFYVRPRDV